MGLFANTMDLHTISADLARNVDDMLVMREIDRLPAPANPFHDAAG